MLMRVFPVILAVVMVGLSWTHAPDVSAEDKKLKVAFALLWTIDDQGWTTSHYNGIKHLQEQMGDKIEVSYTEKVLAADAVLVHPRRVGRKVRAHGAHGRTIAAEQLQVVGDIARAAAELPAHFWHQEGYVQHVYLVGQDVLLELVGEHHDGVVGERSTNECRHGDFHA